MTLFAGDKLGKVVKEKVHPPMGAAAKWYVLEGEVQRIFLVKDIMHISENEKVVRLIEIE